MPIVGNFYKGLSVSVPLHLAHAEARHDRPTQLHAALARALRRRALRPRHAACATRRRSTSGYFDVQACNDTNRVDLFVFASDDPGDPDGRLDNLGKGASGAAVQSMNVHLGPRRGDRAGLAARRAAQAAPSAGVR